MGFVYFGWFPDSFAGLLHRNVGIMGFFHLPPVSCALVTLGAPKLCSMTTLRPLGPKVTATASASRSAPAMEKPGNPLGMGALDVQILEPNGKMFQPCLITRGHLESGKM